MPSLAALCQLAGHRSRRLGPAARAVPTPGWRGWAIAALLACLVVWAPASRAQAPRVELQDLTVRRDDGAVVVDYQLRIALPRAVEEAAERGVPLYFVAQAEVFKPRWYWRDDRVARATREWRLSFQPLTSNWRVSQGGLGQSFPTLSDALATMTRSAGWRVGDAREADADGRPYLEFSWRLDTAQLPRPMQIGLGGVGGSSDWSLGVERSVRLP